MLEYLDKNKDSIKREVYRICKEEDIDYIFTLAKKGTFLFDIIFDNQEELFIDELNKFVYVYSDRIINKNNDFSFLKNQKILLFDDSIRTGNHFKHTIDYLTDKIKESCDMDNLATSFICYSIKQCSYYQETINKHLNNHQLIVYDQEDTSYYDYYKFCIQESEYFQNETSGNSVDLPIFNIEIDDLYDFRELLTVIFNNHKQLDIGISHENKIMDIIIFDDNCHLKRYLDDFLLSSMCKLKYQRKDDSYYVSIISYALTSSIEYDVLYKWYKTIFKDYFGKVSKDIKQRDLSFVKMYRYMNFLISYYIGKYFSNILDEYGIHLKYNEENTIKQFGTNYNFYIKSLYDDYGLNIFSRIKDKYQLDFFDEIDDTNNKYDIQKVSEEVFKAINDQKENNQSHILEIEKFKDLYQEIGDLKLFDAAILTQQERFAISNEIELSHDKKMIYRGFAPGECSMALLPYRANIFYAAIYELYEKANKQYNLYKRNYKQFIEKIDIYFELEKIYINKILKKSQFDFLSKYFYEINESSFNENIEAKKYMLEDKSQYLIVVIREAAKLILENTDFDF